MAPRNVPKQQAEQTDTGEDSDSEKETLDPKAISRDMEKNVGTTWIELPAFPPRYSTYDTDRPLTDARQKGPKAQPAICNLSAGNFKS
jgi:hypothetical protein